MPKARHQGTQFMIKCQLACTHVLRLQLKGLLLHLPHVEVTM